MAQMKFNNTSFNAKPSVRMRGDSITEKMTSSQVQDAQQLTREWMSKHQWQYFKKVILSGDNYYE